MTEVGADIHQTMEGLVNDLFTHHVSVMTEVGADLHQTMEGSVNDLCILHSMFQ